MRTTLIALLALTACATDEPIDPRERSCNDFEDDATYVFQGRDCAFVVDDINWEPDPNRTSPGVPVPVIIAGRYMDGAASAAVSQAGSQTFKTSAMAWGEQPNAVLGVAVVVEWSEDPRARRCVWKLCL